MRTWKPFLEVGAPGDSGVAMLSSSAAGEIVEPAELGRSLVKTEDAGERASGEEAMINKRRQGDEGLLRMFGLGYLG